MSAGPVAAPELPKYSAQADGIFNFLKQTFFQMPVWAQVVGWFALLFLFMFLVLYPLIGITYYEGKVKKIDRSPDTGAKITPNVPKLRVHQTTTAITNEDGEFTMAIRGPIVPLTDLEFDVGEGNATEEVYVRAPVPFLSLFNPNYNTLYWVPACSKQHYFLNEKEAEKAFEASLSGNAKTLSGSLDGQFVHASNVYAASTPAAPGFTVRIHQFTLNLIDAAKSIYLEVSVNGNLVQVNGIPNGDSPSSRLLSVEPGKALRFDNFDIPVGEGQANIQIRVFERRLLLRNNQIAYVNLQFSPASVSAMPAEQTFRSGNLEVDYRVLPPMDLACAGIESTKKKNLEYFMFWLQPPTQYLDSIAAVQYDLGPSFNSRTVTFPLVDSWNHWAYSVLVYSPQLIHAKVTLHNGESADVSGLCKLGVNPETAMGDYALAAAYRFDQQYDQAISFAEKAQEKDATLKAAAMATKAAALTAQKHYESALQIYRAALSSGAAPPELLNSYAWFLADGLPSVSPAQLREAKDLASKAATRAPNASYMDTLGWAEYKLGEYQEALVSLQAASALLVRDSLKTTSTWQAVECHLGFTLQALGRKPEALAAFTEVTAFAKTNPNSNDHYVEAVNQQIAKIGS